MSGLYHQRQDRTHRRAHVHPNPDPIHVQPSLESQFDVHFVFPLFPRGGRGGRRSCGGKDVREDEEAKGEEVEDPKDGGEEVERSSEW